MSGRVARCLVRHHWGVPLVAFLVLFAPSTALAHKHHPSCKVPMGWHVAVQDSKTVVATNGTSYAYCLRSKPRWRPVDLGPQPIDLKLAGTVLSWQSNVQVTATDGTYRVYPATQVTTENLVTRRSRTAAPVPFACDVSAVPAGWHVLVQSQQAVVASVGSGYAYCLGGQPQWWTIDLGEQPTDLTLAGSYLAWYATWPPSVTCSYRWGTFSYLTPWVSTENLATERLRAQVYAGVDACSAGTPRPLLLAPDGATVWAFWTQPGIVATAIQIATFGRTLASGSAEQISEPQIMQTSTGPYAYWTDNGQCIATNCVFPDPNNPADWSHWGQQESAPLDPGP